MIQPRLHNRHVPADTSNRWKGGFKSATMPATGDAGIIYADPNTGSAIGAAIQWLEGTLLGSVATTVAVLAVASVGFMMLTGRVELRRAAQIVFGCFIIFGASSIAAGIQTAVSDVASGDESQQATAYYPSSPPPDYPQASQSDYDPYAGAALAPR